MCEDSFFKSDDRAEEAGDKGRSPRDLVLGFLGHSGLRAFLLFTFLELENFLYWLPKGSCYFQGQHGRGDVFLGFDGIDGLSADANRLCQLLLSHAHYGTLHF